MSQHLGAPANPIVQVGDIVKVGQKIGEAAGFISAPVHSSVSGTVVAVEPRMHGTRGSEVMAVVIESDGKNTTNPYSHMETLTSLLRMKSLRSFVKQESLVWVVQVSRPVSS